MRAIIEYEQFPGTPYPHVFTTSHERFGAVWWWCREEFGLDPSGERWEQGAFTFLIAQNDDALRLWIRWSGDDV